MIICQKVCNVVFRVDASLEIGSGHVMRCLTVAQALVLFGHTSIFICREKQGDLIDFIQSKGFEVIKLPKKNNESLVGYKGWLGVSEYEDALDVLTYIRSSDRVFDICIVDHYGLSAVWEGMIRNEIEKIVVIDDLANREHDADIILDCGLSNNAQQYEKLNKAKGVYLVGSSYALLRPEFAEQRKLLDKKEPVSIQAISALKILVNLGGVDKDNVSEKILFELNNTYKQRCIDVTLILGQSSPHKERLTNIGTQLSYPLQVLVGVNNMAELMANHDLAIGAAGSTSWERCCLGLPTLMVCLAENQIGIAEELENVGAAIIIDLYNLQELSSVLTSVDLTQLTEIRKKALAVTDGKGVKRLLEVLLK